jgi:CBS domain-containing protein
MKISQILTVKGDSVVTIAPDDRVVTVLSLLAEHRIGAIVVSSGDRRIDGIVSERDIVRAMAADPDAGTTGGVRPRPVSSIMSAEVVTIELDTDVDQAMSIMTESRFRHLPVVDSDGLLAGIVSIGDVVKAKLAALEDERAALLEYVNRGG